MLLFDEHLLVYKIIFNNPIDYYNVFFQKQIDLRIRIDGDIKQIVICKFKSAHELLKSFTEKSQKNIRSRYDSRYSFYHDRKLGSWINLIDDSNKYQKIKRAYKSDDFIIGYNEYENIMDNLLEEYKLKVANLQFNEDQQKILNAFVNDQEIKPNIKFSGWIDYWETF